VHRLRPIDSPQQGSRPVNVAATGHLVPLVLGQAHEGRRIVNALVQGVKRIVRAVDVFLTVLFPEPADDLMAIVDATAEPSPAAVERQELIDYHLAVCSAAELMAEVRSGVTPVDFAEWSQEIAGGESR
jgi:hypothetical protein